MPASDAKRGYIIESSVAVLLLKHKIPDSLTEVPVRAAYVDYRGTEAEPALHEECITTGWHFFNHGFVMTLPSLRTFFKAFGVPTRYKHLFKSKLNRAC